MIEICMTVINSDHVAEIKFEFEFEFEYCWHIQLSHTKYIVIL